MCGIGGIAYFNKNRQVKHTQLHSMSEKIAHRGPDDDGIYISEDKSTGLIHKRLAVVDLSAKGHQPMFFGNRYVITFNGEIYNYKELRLKLEKEGLKFKSNSDTEVILALYAKYKIKCLKYLRGMFAFAIYDQKDKTLFIARDRLGKKPVKYHLTEDVFIFASELKAILPLLSKSPGIDYLAIQKYFLYGYVPSPMTGFEGIKKLEPGNYIYIDVRRKKFIKRSYWKPIYKNKLRLTEKQWIQKILDTLDKATRIRMISDVPVGAFLSGGVDSSAVVAAMALNSQKPIKTFSILFEDPKYSEKRYADLIVRRYKTDHTEIMARPTSISVLPDLAYQYEEPFSDNSAVVTAMVSKEARKHVTVVLNGDGGDENFAGYPNRYLRLKRDVDYAKWIAMVRPISALKIKRISRFLDKSKLPIYERFASYNQIFSINEILSLSKGELSETMTYKHLYQRVRNCFEKFKGKDLKDAGLKFDLQNFLPDQLLTKMDIASMKYSLETRSPLLDHKFVELACQIPFNLKVKNGETKYIFKKALEQIVPKQCLYRPKKGFTIPLNEWFKGRLDDYCKKVIFYKKSKLSEFVNLEAINLDTENKKWSLLMLELWLQKYFS